MSKETTEGSQLARARVLPAEQAFLKELFGLFGHQGVAVGHLASMMGLFGVPLPYFEDLLDDDNFVNESAFVEIWVRALESLTPARKLELHLGFFAAPPAGPYPRRAANVSAEALLREMVAAEAVPGASSTSAATAASDKQKYIDFVRGQEGETPGSEIPAGCFLAAAGLTN